MVNTKDILAAERAAKAKQVSQGQLDDEMLAIDVSDMLEDDFMGSGDLHDPEYREAVVARLKDIYDAQGIEADEGVLRDSLTAKTENRFEYLPPKPGFSTNLAKLYINRRKWLPLFYTLALIFGSVFLINYIGFERPAKLEAKRIETLMTKTLPGNLSAARDKALSIAATDELKARIESLYRNGETAIKNNDANKATNMSSNLEQLTLDLEQEYSLRIISRPGEMSGVFRLNDDGGAEVRNYYLIVEGLTASREKVEVSITSEEDQTVKRVTQWGVRVPVEEFQRVAEDKRDDQIIQNAIIGQKKRGFLLPDYSIETSGGTIVDW